VTDIDIDQQLPDDYEFGRERLACVLNEFGQWAADENLLIDIRRGAAPWQLPPPRWTRREVGLYELNTPRGRLIVSRRIGWIVERDGAPLVWRCRGTPVFFDRLEDAKTSALLHCLGEEEFPDGTGWKT
jgi:hypothetical protein